ncbi:putative protein TPRXL, partial [Zootermopsis nevadensis]|uniref:putative protein TPRXL n=1 Tax=Zootermopsis nevadensis TaxID=136037 RepID=UPI000B8E476C
MSRSPDPESTTPSVEPSSGIRIRSASPCSSSSVREKSSPTLVVSRNKSPVPDIIRKGPPTVYPSYPIVVPTIRRAPPACRSPDTRRSRSPMPSCVPVITTGRRGSSSSSSSSARIPSSSSPRRDTSPTYPEGPMRCISPSEDSPGSHHRVHLIDTKLCRETSPSGRRVSSADGRNNESAPSSSPGSRQLKFGMDRILSEEISPTIRRHQYQ